MRMIPVLVMLASGAVPLSGQATVRLTLGATYSSTLARDQIVADRNLYLHTSVAPTVAAGVSLPTGRGYRVVLEGEYAHSSVYMTEDSARSNLWGLGTATLLALLDGPLTKSVRWEVGGGRIFYLPAERIGLFQSGGPGAWTFAAGASWARPISPHLAVLATLRYTLHDFTTATLKASGFQQSESVHRVGLLIGLERRL